jgi:hypothetical protein
MAVRACQLADSWPDRSADGGLDSLGRATTLLLTPRQGVTRWQGVKVP